MLRCYAQGPAKHIWDKNQQTRRTLSLVWGCRSICTALHYCSQTVACKRTILVIQQLLMPAKNCGDGNRQ